MLNFNLNHIKYLLLVSLIMLYATSYALAQQPDGSSWDLSISPNGLYVASAQSSGSIIIYDISGNIIQILPAHLGIVVAVEWSSDGTLLASGGMDNVLRLWDTTSWSLIHEIEVPSNEIYNLSWQPNGNILIASGLDTFFMWDTTTWNMMLDPLAVSLSDLQWSPDGTSFAFAAIPNYVGVATLIDKKLEVSVFKGHRSVPYAISWNSNGVRIASAGGTDGTVRLWDPKSGLEIAKVLDIEGTITDVVFLNEHLLVVSTGQGDVFIINITTGERVDIQSVNLFIRSLEWNPVWKNIVIAGEEHEDQVISRDLPENSISFLIIQETKIDINNDNHLGIQQCTFAFVD